MKTIRFQIASALAAIVLAGSFAAPVAFAKGSGFSSSHSSFSSSSSHSYSSGSSSSSYHSSSSSSTVSRSSGFSSSGSSKSIPTTPLGSSLYAAQSSRDAAATLNTSQSSRNGGGSGSSVGGSYGGTPSYGATRYSSPAPVYSAPSYSAPAPQTVIVHQSSGINSFLFGWLLGHDSSPRETVVVQQPAAPMAPSSSDSGYQKSQPGSPPVSAMAGGSDDASGVQAQSDHLPSAAAVPQATHEQPHPFLTVLKWIVGIGIAGVLVTLLHRAWAARKARFTAQTNYRL